MPEDRHGYYERDIHFDVTIEKNEYGDLYLDSSRYLVYASSAHNNFECYGIAGFCL